MPLSAALTRSRIDAWTKLWSKLVVIWNCLRGTTDVKVNCSINEFSPLRSPIVGPYSWNFLIAFLNKELLNFVLGCKCWCIVHDSTDVVPNKIFVNYIMAMNTRNGCVPDVRAKERTRIGWRRSRSEVQYRTEEHSFVVLQLLGASRFLLLDSTRESPLVHPSRKCV